MQGLYTSLQIIFSICDRPSYPQMAAILKIFTPITMLFKGILGESAAQRVWAAQLPVLTSCGRFSAGHPAAAAFAAQRPYSRSRALPGPWRLLVGRGGAASTATRRRYCRRPPRQPPLALLCCLWRRSIAPAGSGSGCAAAPPRRHTCLPLTTLSPPSPQTRSRRRRRPRTRARARRSP